MTMAREDLLVEQLEGRDADGFKFGRISPSRFTDPAVLASELDKVFPRTWLYACPVSDVARPGDTYPFTIGHDRIVVVHGDDGVIRAMYNVCQHRGRQLITEPRNVRSLFCPFHGFDWNLDGSIRNVIDKDCFQGYTNEADLDLPKVQCTVWQGLVWINMDPDAESLEVFLGEVGKQLSAYRLADYRLEEELFVEWDCNWKIAADAFHEGYHGPVTHPQLQFYLEDADDMPIDLYGLHSRGLYHMGAPCSRLTPEQRFRAQPGLKAMAASAGVNADDYEGRLDEMRLAMQKGMRAKLTAQGYDASALSDDQMTDDYHYYIFPNVTINQFAGRFSIFRYMPHPKDPSKCTFWVHTFVRPEVKGSTIPRPEPVYGKGLDYKFDSEVYNQDARNVPWCQSGVQSRGFKGMLFNRQERRLRHMYESLDRFIEG
jgi:phenylpropionate dioxygenase-like ring-hydroxylating dioxygenase large terminal subunit